jgi:hypothetical protein
MGHGIGVGPLTSHDDILDVASVDAPVAGDDDRPLGGRMQ